MKFAPLLTVSLLLLPNLARAASFTPLGFFPDDAGQSYGSDVSADGAVVVGFADGAHIEAYRWGGGSMVGLGDLTPGDPIHSGASAVSADGSVVVGMSVEVDWDTEAFRWSGGTMTGLGVLPGDSSSDATGVSADGNVVVGSSRDVLGLSEAFRWTDGAMTGLGFLPDGVLSEAYGVSDSGEVVVGYSRDVAGYATAFRWQNGVMSELDGFPDGVFSVAGAVSADGEVVVGVMSSEAGDQAFRWDAGEILALGYPSDLLSYSTALGVSGDGSVVVGFGGDAGEDMLAFLWTETDGMQPLIDRLVANGATGLEGWTLTEAAAVSPDGRWVVGSGVNPDGHIEAFLADITPVPEPSASWLLGSALAALACARRRLAL